MVFLADYLHNAYGIAWERIRKDWYILADAEYHDITVRESVSKPLAERTDIIRHPDIMILKEGCHYSPELIIEMDGAVHHTKPGRKKTEKRNADYRYMGVPLIIIDLPDLAEAGTNWMEFLDRQLAAKLPK